MQEGVVACGMVRLNVVYDQHGLMCDRDKMIPAVPMAPWLNLLWLQPM